MERIDEILEKWTNDCVRHAVEWIDFLIRKEGLSPFDKKNYGKFYKAMNGKVDVDVPLITKILRDWIFFKAKYEKDFGKPRLVMLKTQDNKIDFKMIKSSISELA